MNWYLIYGVSTETTETEINFRIFSTEADARKFLMVSEWVPDDQHNWHLDYWTLIKGDIVAQNGVTK